SQRASCCAHPLASGRVSGTLVQPQTPSFFSFVGNDAHWHRLVCKRPRTKRTHPHKEDSRLPRRELFRQEAVQFQFRNRKSGKIALLQPPSTKLLAWLLFGSIIAIIAFACGAQYARKETVVGYLRPTAGTAKIFVPQRGVVKELHVTDGDEV